MSGEMKRASIGRTPYSLFKDGISDHTPVSFRLSHRKQLDKDCQTVPSFVTKSKEFAIALKQLEIKAQLDEMCVTERWESHKSLLKQA
eukprot:6617219-Karenia_brevis.AAC.1